MHQQPDDELFDDLHEGVEALRTAAQENNLVLSERASQSLQRLKTSVPAIRHRTREWKDRLRTQAVKAAQKTDQAAHRHPWAFALGALGLGILAGFAIADTPSESDESGPATT